MRKFSKISIFCINTPLILKLSLFSAQIAKGALMMPKCSKKAEIRQYFVKKYFRFNKKSYLCTRNRYTS